MRSGLRFTLSLTLACAIAAAAASARGPHDATSHRSFADVERWSAVFDDPARDAWQQPAALVDALRLRPGMTVAEIGAGTGYLLRYLAAAVGSVGSVLLVEIEPNLVAHMRDRAEREGAGQVVPILGSRDNPRIPAATAEVVLFLDSYHHIDDRIEYMRKLQRALTPDGRVVIVDWRKEELPVGPPVDHKLDRRHVTDEMQRAGYALRAVPLELPYHYVLEFERSRRAR